MRLAEWLKESKTTQDSLAKACGVTQGRISQIVLGAAPSLMLAGKIKEATGGAVTPDDFLALEAAE